MLDTFIQWSDLLYPLFLPLKLQAVDTIYLTKWIIRDALITI